MKTIIIGGVAGGAFKATGAQGQTAQGAGGAAWKRGVGGVAKSQMTASGTRGSYSGKFSGKYNAMTGTGSRNKAVLVPLSSEAPSYLMA